VHQVGSIYKRLYKDTRSTKHKIPHFCPLLRRVIYDLSSFAVLFVSLLNGTSFRQENTRYIQYVLILQPFFF